MGDKSAIEWTDATWTVAYGCTKVSPGCAHCYIERTPPYRMAGLRFERGAIPLQLMPERLDWPLRWQKPRRIFVNSMTDTFHEDIPDEFLDRLFAVMALTPQHTYQVLTKRPERMREYIRRVEAIGWDGVDFSQRRIGGLSMGYGLHVATNPNHPFPLPNVWLGVSVENQRWADERIPILLDTPAAVRFLSCEPLLGRVDIRQYLGYHPVHNGSPEIRRESGLSGGLGRRVRDRQLGPDLAGQTPPLEPLDEDRRDPALRTEEGRKRDRGGLSANPSDVWEPADSRARPSPGLSALLRPDSRRDGDQSQERQQGRQPALQFGADNVLGKQHARSPSAEAWPLESEGHRECDGEVDAREGSRDSFTSQQGRIAEGHSSRLRDQRPNGLEDSARTALGLSPSISWVIVGGESGPKHRPMNPDWARSIVGQCREAGVACFMKQLGGARPGTKLEDLPPDLRVREYPA